VNYFTLARMCRRLLHCCYKVVPGRPQIQSKPLVIIDRGRAASSHSHSLTGASNGAAVVVHVPRGTAALSIKSCSLWLHSTIWLVETGQPAAATRARVGRNGLQQSGARSVMLPWMQLSFLFDCDDVALPALKLDPDTELARVVPADVPPAGGSSRC
jgi:hypothetical protein